MQEDTKSFIGKAYVQSNRSKLTRMSLDKLSKQYGENQMKTFEKEKTSRNGWKPVSKSRNGYQLSSKSLADLHLGSTNEKRNRKLPVTVRQLAKFDQKSNRNMDDPYATPQGELKSKRSSVVLSSRRPI